MRLKPQGISTVALITQMSIASVACAAELISVPLPDHSELLTELRSEHLIVAYQDTSGATVHGLGLDGRSEWREHFRGERLRRIDADHSGSTVVVHLAEDPEEGFKNVVFRQGRKSFDIVHRGALHVSSDGRFFLPLGEGGTLFRELMDERGDTLALPAELRSGGGNLNFAGSDRLLFRIGDPPDGERGTLGLLRLPSDLLWNVPFEPGELHVWNGLEEAIALENGLLLVGEPIAVSRHPKLYCLDGAGKIKWGEPARVTGIGMLKGRVVTLEKPGVVVRDRETGKTIAQTELPVSALLRHGGRWVIEFRDELIFLATVSGSGIGPYRVPIRVRFEPDGELTASVLEAYRGVAVVGPNLVGLRHDAEQQRLIVEVIE